MLLAPFATCRTTTLAITGTRQLATVGKNSEPAGRRELLIQNVGAAPIFLGGSDVTAANGVRLAVDATLALYSAGGVWLISGGVDSEARILEAY